MGFEWFWFYFVCWSSLVCSFPVFACIFLSWLYTLELSNASLVCNNLSSRWGARCSQWTIEVADVSPIPQLRNVHHQTWYQARSCKIYSIICAFLRLAAAEILPSKFTCLLTIIQDKYIYWTPSPPVRPPFVELGELPSRKLTLPPDEKWWFRVQRQSFPFGAFRPIFRWNPEKQPQLPNTSCQKKIVHYFGTFQFGVPIFQAKKKGIRGIFSSVWKLEHM